VSQADLFGTPGPALPAGMRLEEEFLSRDEERSFVATIAALPLANMKYQQYTARRRVVSYGGQYDFSAQKLDEAEPLPAWLDPLRERAGAWAGIAPERFTQALVAEYAPGTPLGWHRDVPDFEDVVGVSLLDEAVMRFPLSAGARHARRRHQAHVAAAVNLPAARGVAVGVAARGVADEGVAVFDHLADGFGPPALSPPPELAPARDS
jgi:alkylated DNA repair dioxygenase AlkB